MGAAVQPFVPPSRAAGKRAGNPVVAGRRFTASITFRAGVALALTAGFYVGALAIVAGLLYVPYAELVHAGRLHLRLAVFCLVGAGIILWALVPRADRFTPPGPLLTPQVEPRLFALIREVATATGQPMPAEVYLVPEVNAWVTQRGGVMGLGGRRVMGLGLPLLASVTEAELRAVIAHELGHFHGGDTRLAPWIYKTRVALVRTIEGLSAHSALLHLPFVWYAGCFLRVSQAVSRHQELMADALAARTAGVAAVVDGLMKVHGAGRVFAGFWATEVVPVLRAGALPPVGEGFQRYLAAEPVQRAMQDAVSATRAARHDAYDTHPSLPERIRAVRGRATLDPPSESRPAMALLSRLPDLERQLVTALAPAHAHGLRPVRWEDVPVQVYLPMWQAAVREHRGALAWVTVDELPSKARNLASAIGARVASESGQAWDEEMRLRHGAWVLGAVLAARLAGSGWSITGHPGEPFVLVGPGGTLDPFSSTAAMVEGALAGETWDAACARVEIVGLTLVEPTESPAETVREVTAVAVQEAAAPARQVARAGKPARSRSATRPPAAAPAAETTFFRRPVPTRGGATVSYRFLSPGAHGK